VYGLFPGKAALFRELLIAFSPIETIVETVERLRDRPPEEVIPTVARAAAGTLAGRVGIVRALVFEISGPSEETADALGYMAERGIGMVIRYV